MTDIIYTTHPWTLALVVVVSEPCTRRSQERQRAIVNFSWSSLWRLGLNATRMVNRIYSLLDHLNLGIGRLVILAEMIQAIFLALVLQRHSVDYF